MKNAWIIAGLVWAVAFGALGQKIVGLNVSAAATTRPALKYRLTFAPEQSTGENPIELYQKAAEAISDPGDQLSDLLDVAIGETDERQIARVKTFLKENQPALDLAMQIGKCRQCPAEYPDFSNLHDLMNTRISQGNVKELSMLVLLKAKMEASEGHFDQAMAWVRVSMRLAEHSAQGWLLTEQMVAEGVLSQTNNALLEIIQTPGSPNLYWPLAQLRRPMVDVGRSIDAELSIIPNCFKDVEDPLKMTAEQWQRSFGNFVQMMNQNSAKEAPISIKISGAIYGAMLEPAGREYMLKNGFTEDQIKKYEPVQIVGYYLIDSTRRDADEMRKRLQLPYWRLATELPLLQKEMDEGIKNILNLIQNLSISPQFLKRTMSNQAKVERQFSMLKNIEALRDFAARHGNELPKTLDEIKDLTLDLDPVTGKAFEWIYKDKKTGSLSSPGEVSMDPLVEMYEIQVKIK